MVLNSDQINAQLIELIKNSRHRLTPLTVEKQFLSKHPDISKKYLALSLRELISKGELTYTYEFGSSFIELSFEKPVRVSDHVILKSVGISFSPVADDIVITLQKGAAFGSGRHPSTRLALTAMEKILLGKNTLKRNHLSVLDIGTGSGVLAIAAVLMGMKKAIGLDIDPCARSEAMQNIGLNGLTDSVIVEQIPVESIRETFGLILANLRFPTLSNMLPTIEHLLENKGIAVLSGLKQEEVAPVVERYQTANITNRYLFTEKEWAAVVLQKRGTV